MCAKVDTTSRNGILRRVADHVLPPLAWGLCRALGVAACALTNRQEVAERNLALAFPDRDAKWHRRTARKSILYMFELFAIPLVNPWLSEKTLRERFQLSSGIDERICKMLEEGKAMVVQPPHFATSEALTLLPARYEKLEVSDIYRPLDFGPADRYVHWARSRWGLKMYSRKDALLELHRRLGKGEIVSIPFDQNTINAGALVLCFGRVCAATELPSILASKGAVDSAIVVARRKGFLRASFELVEVAHDGTKADMTARYNLALERTLSEDEELCASWMWAHRRWKHNFTNPGQCLTLKNRKDYLANSLAALGLKELPRREPFVLRLPDSPELAASVASWLPKLREGRKDVRWIIVAPEAAAGMFRMGGNCERVVTFAEGDARSALESLRSEWPGFIFCLETDANACEEAKACRAERIVSLSLNSEVNKRNRKTFRVTEDQLSAGNFHNTLATVFHGCGLEA
jgi:lauroyl/myristoyl acyltransferase